VARRVHQLAKELGVNSTAIEAKCQNEGLDIKNHMSTLSAGLEATIREWFSEGEHSTAVETTERVDLEKVKVKRPSRKKAAVREKAPDKTEEESAVLTEEVPESQETIMPATVPVETVEAPVAAEPEEPAIPEPAVVLPTTHISLDKHKPKRKSPKEIAQGDADQGHPAAPAAEMAPESPPAEESTPEQPEAASADKGVAPAVQRMIETKPVKPKTPAPRASFVPAPAQLQGPQVIRVEHAEYVPAPGSRSRKPPFPPSDSARPAPVAPAEAAPAEGKQRHGRRHVSLDEDTSEGESKGKRRSARHRGGRRTAEPVDSKGRHEWGDLDLLERQERLAGASGRKLHTREKLMAQGEIAGAGSTSYIKPSRIEKAVVKQPIMVKDLSAAIGVRISDILAKLMQMGVMATINDRIDKASAEMIALEYGVELTVEEKIPLLQQLQAEFDKEIPEEELKLRPPVVAFLGHVDHGKTSLLDRIRQAHVVKGEAGGITQHIGSYLYDDGKRRVTFLDTPGHKAFTAMRARGANMTDIVVLVVAADDGVMPQTEEAINHAKAAGVPIVVALNKIDLPSTNEHKVLGELAAKDLVASTWGGSTEVVRTSATTGEGITDLVEHLDYVAELHNLRAKYDGPATGWVIEAEMTTGQGVAARLLVKQGTLKPGDIVVSGKSYGKIRTIIDAQGQRLKEAGPSTPVEITGLDEIPRAGDRFFVVDNISRAHEIAQEQKSAEREKELSQRRQITLENLFQEISAGQVRELNVIVKADVQGSVDVLTKTLMELNTAEVAVRVLHASVGGISESDILLAEASNAVVIGFHVSIDEHARALAETSGVEVRLYKIIYQISDDIRKALEGMLLPQEEEKLTGHVEVRNLFRISRIGVIAGCYVTDGNIKRSAQARLIRDGIVIRDNIAIESLRRNKDDVTEVRNGLECGIKLADFDDLKIGDIIETFEIVKVGRTLPPATGQ